MLAASVPLLPSPWCSRGCCFVPLGALKLPAPRTPGRSRPAPPFGSRENRVSPVTVFTPFIGGGPGAGGEGGGGVRPYILSASQSVKLPPDPLWEVWEGWATP